MNKVFSNIYIGSVAEAIKKGNDFDFIVCVMDLSELSRYEAEDYMLIRTPILIASAFRSEVLDIYLDPDVLDKAAKMLDMCARNNWKTLLHCAAGEERSPLTMMYYLHKYLEMDIESAYKVVKERHPRTQKRLSWLKKCEGFKQYEED